MNLRIGNSTKFIFRKNYNDILVAFQIFIGKPLFIVKKTYFQSQKESHLSNHHLMCYNFPKQLRWGVCNMSYISELLNYIDSASIEILLELLLVTTCISTIIYLVTKNQYISYLSSAPIFYFLSLNFNHNSHFMLLILAMTVQASVILFIQKKDLLKVITAKEQSSRQYLK